MTLYHKIDFLSFAKQVTMDYPATAGTCERPPKNVSFFVNAVLHVLILLVIVSTFYFAFVEKLSREKFQEELEDLINTNLGPALINGDKDGALKTALQGLNMDHIVSYYQNKTDKAMQIQNRWLFRVVIMAILFLVVTIVLTVYILKISCHQCAPFSHILKENLLLFMFVGFVEVTFFLMIARKFVPTQPSLMMQSIVDSLKANFKSSQ
jgi:flagellar biosynthesis/type III secretory pathway M-ring protein FliF/YscJ